MICPQKHLYQSTPEEKILTAMFGSRQDDPIEMDLVVDTPIFQKYECHICKHTETLLLPDADLSVRPL